ncbi:hypothetical protein MNBD_UNCLBAC01-1524 [hydrothermal vent metagenome]|uniref:Sulfatase-modifying factor enzyme-like domain-containing protein n=1 Tax=hydrothermal vent metagenome TaxID=652676 RepID=A0A3B1DST2_9ZZZZ
MKRSSLIFFNVFNFFVLYLLLCPFVFANNLSISNVSLEQRDPSANTAVVEFDVSWENSWRTKINHDAIWLTIRLKNPSVSPPNKKLCQISASGLNPAGTSTGSNASLELSVSTDQKGAFLRPAFYGVNNSVSTTNVQVTIDYSSCGFSSTDSVKVSVVGLEMVLIPEGAFYAGDYNGSTAALQEGSSDSDPWYISGESVVSVTNASSNGYRYVSAGNAGEDVTGASFTISTDFPKGYGAFYVMKYEITEGQWVEFFNAIPSSAARVNRDLTNSAHKNSDAVKYRNTVSCSGSPLTCASSRSVRAVNYLTWMDLAAFLDWMALRPMTELEYEKMARGSLLAVSGEFSWGTTSITAAKTISGSSEDGSETITNSEANANYNNQTFTGGDSSNGVDYAQGPLRGGVFATASSTRVSAGSGYYGVMELSGNVRERIVTIGHSTGRSFTAGHGDGVLTTASGYEGNANVTDWPGTDATASRGVTGADGSGFRGGAWDDQLSGVRLRISDRNDAAKSDTSAYNNAGGRGVRTYEN